MAAGYKWKEIADLPEDLAPFRDRELESLREIWGDEEKRMGDAGLTSDFSDRLAREWAIETGIIEGVYTLDRGITQTLIERGIDSSYIPHDATNRDPELVARTIQAHGEALDGLFAFVKGERPLGTSYIKELHQALLRYQETVVVYDPDGRPFETKLEKGVYKRLPNNPRRPDGSMHEYCPPEHVDAEMDRMIELHPEHEAKGVPAHVEAAWLHHAFTQIHPFQDGNGRVARALASLVFIKAEYFPLLVTRDDREKYIEALERADAGEFPELVRFFAQAQKSSLTRAVVWAADTRPITTVEEAVAVTRDLLVGVGRIPPLKYNDAKTTAHLLFQRTNASLTTAAQELTTNITQADAAFQFQSGTFGPPPAREISLVAEKLRYDANTSAWHQSCLLTLRAATAQSRLVVSFHSIGRAFRGLLAAVAYFQQGDGAPEPVVDDIFRITYQEPQKEAAERFAQWLDAAIIEGLAKWRRTLV